MTTIEARKLAYQLIVTELDIARGCGNIAENPDCPDDPADADQVESQIDKILSMLGERSV